MRVDSAENMHGIQPYSEGQIERRDGELEIVTQSFMSPSSESPPNDSISIATSEKARGKMKERRSLSLETNRSPDRVAATGVGRNGFVPTQEWVGLNASLYEPLVFIFYILGHFLAPRVGTCYKTVSNLLTAV
jgi:hypothetical protein